MRILHYNIFNGFDNGRIPLSPLRDWLEANPVDVLLVNEHRDSPEWSALRETAGFRHGVVNRHTEKRNGNLTAVFSRLPFEGTPFVPEGLRVVAVRVAGMHLVATHGFPDTSDVIADDADRLVTELESWKGEPVLVAGDFNALAASDADRLGYAALVGSAREGRYCCDGQPSFEAMEAFAKAGFTDLCAGHPEPTVSTSAPPKPRKKEGRPLRIDYALTRDLAARARRLAGEPFERLSDHYPLWIEVG
ncbi:MAG: endonuclease/exonuclease/phosphatase family protein [Opitutales bacterium]|nr:endonuclease/exonuclease/phosphatase family protein [Opitutales bacterium]